MAHSTIPCKDKSALQDYISKSFQSHEDCNVEHPFELMSFDLKPKTEVYGSNKTLKQFEWTANRKEVPALLRGKVPPPVWANTFDKVVEIYLKINLRAKRGSFLSKLGSNNKKVTSAAWRELEQEQIQVYEKLGVPVSLAKESRHGNETILGLHFGPPAAPEFMPTVSDYSHSSVGSNGTAGTEEDSEQDADLVSFISHSDGIAGKEPETDPHDVPATTLAPTNNTQQKRQQQRKQQPPQPAIPKPLVLKRKSTLNSIVEEQVEEVEEVKEEEQQEEEKQDVVESMGKIGIGRHPVEV